MSVRRLVHYWHRGRELGLWGTFRQASVRATRELTLVVHSVWWGWKARRGMSNTALLARTTGEWRSSDALLDHLAGRSASSFVLPLDSASEIATILERDYPDSLADILSAADSICRSELPLLGETYSFPHGIDWHTDPVSGWRWPVLHRGRMAQHLESDRPVDLIVFWELNRHQHFITLGIAFWLTGDHRYVDAFVGQVQSWIAANPLRHGANWFHGLEIACRLVAWTVAFQFFRGSPQFRSSVGTHFLKSLWEQADFLRGHLQPIRTPGVTPNNHLIGELTALAIVGAAFPEFKEATAWRDAGLRGLAEQAMAQTHPDGVNREQASGYHRFVAELLILVVARNRRGGLPRVPILESTLEKMIEYMLFATSPGGTAPMWGDSDYGRALGLGHHKDFANFRPLLAVGAVLFGRPDFKFGAGRFDEEALWVLGTDGMKVWGQLDARHPERSSRAFPEAGQYVIRDSWATDSDVGFFRCGPFGLGGEGSCAHAHCDLLSVVLWVNGRWLLVDSGTYAYHGPWRNYFRLTAAHNTVVIDGRDQATPLSHFNWSQVPTARCLAWSEKQVTGTVIGAGQVAFTRELSHSQPDLWRVVDTFVGGGDSHTASWFFHFAEGLVLRAGDASAITVVDVHGEPFMIINPPQDVRVAIVSTWRSSSYGNKVRCPALEAMWEGAIPVDGITFCWSLNRVGNGIGGSQ